MQIISKNTKIINYKLLYLLLSFFIPCVLFIICIIGLRILPFGTNTLVISDANNSYMPLLSYIGRMLKGSEGILYSFKNGLGGNNLSILAWGMINPSFALAIFSDLESLPTMYTWIVMVNIAFSSLTMYILLSEVYGWKFSNLIFSVSYAMIGFSVVNNFQIIFYTGVHMLPLMVLGLYRMFHGKSPVLYIFSLAYCIFANFFFGYVLCIASVVFFIAYMAEHAPELFGKKKEIIINYGISSLLSGFIPAFILLPMIKSMTGGGRMDQATIFDFSFDENMPFISIFTKLFSGANSKSEMIDGLPNIFCGILVVALVILFFMNRKIERRHKIAVASVIAFYLLTFYIVALSLAMQGFSPTNWFPYRYSFVFSFILIFVAAEEFSYLNEISIKETHRCGAVILISTILIVSQKYEYLSGGAVVIDLLLLFVMWFGFWMYKKDPQKSPERTLTLFLLLLVCGNQYENFYLSTKAMKELDIDLKDYYHDVLIYGSFADAVNTSDEVFFRMENEYSRNGASNHDSKLLNYQNISIYSPTQRTFVSKALSKLGLSYYTYGEFYSKGVPSAVDNLLGIRYLISERDLTGEKDYQRLFDLNGNYLYSNPDAQSVVMLGTNQIDDFELERNAFININRIWSSLTGKNADIFDKVENITFTFHYNYDDMKTNSDLINPEDNSLLDALPDLGTDIKIQDHRDIDEKTDDNKSGHDEEENDSGVYIEYSFIAEKDGPVYLYNSLIQDLTYGTTLPCMKYIGTFHKGDIVNGKYQQLISSAVSTKIFESCCASLYFAYADNNLLAEYSTLLQNRPVTLNKDSERILSGNFTATDTENRLFFTIPWDEGWTCYIDGEKAEIAKSCGCFMTVAVPAGTHTYEMRFFPAWMKAGIIISIVSLAACVVYLILFNKYTKKEEPVTENEPSSDDTPETERTGALPETVPEIPAKEAAT